MRREGLAFSIDILGEATINEEEAQQYAHAYIELLDGLTSAPMESAFKPAYIHEIYIA